MVNHAFTVTLSITTQEGCREAFLALLQKKLPIIRQQQGCLQATLCADTSDDNKFLLVEFWESYPLWQKHLQSELVAHITEACTNLTTKWELHKYSPCKF